MNSVMHRLFQAAVLVFAMVVGGAAVHAAVHADGRSPWYSGSESPFVSRNTRPVMDRLLEMVPFTEDQRTLLEALHAEHIARFGDHAQKCRDLFDKWQERERLEGTSANRLALGVEREIEMAPMADRQAELDREFDDAIRAMLLEEQKPAFEDFLKWVRRNPPMAVDYVYLEGTLDLIDVLDHLELDETDAIDPPAFMEVRRRYMDELDAAIVRRAELGVKLARNTQRNQARSQQASALMQTFDEDGNRTLGGVTDPEWLESHRRDRRELAERTMALGVISRRYIEAFAVQLQPEAQGEFRAEILRRLSAVLWNIEDSPGRRFASRALELAGVGDEHRAQIEAAVAHNEIRVRRHLERMVETENERMATSFDPDSSADDRAKARDRHHALVNELWAIDNELIDLVCAQLTPEQREAANEPKRAEPVPSIG
jgi:hypothetical protein